MASPWQCYVFGHKTFDKPDNIHNNDGSVAYQAWCCRRSGCWYRKPTTEEGKRIQATDRARVNAYMNGERAARGLPFKDMFK